MYTNSPEADTPDLPTYRIAAEFAFTKIGLDHAGPLLVKDIYAGGTMYKAYICLFTCASTRNVHLELTPDLGVDALIRCLKRFMARRGVMELVISDNFKTFISEDVKAFLSKERIKWNFILPKAPWWGGFYERLIRIVKECLRKTLGKARLTYEELETLLLEVEMVINSRPLTYLNNETMESLTPSHLVIGRRLLSRRDEEGNVDDDYDRNNDELNKRFEYLNTLLKHYWSRFNSEYLSELRERHINSSKGSKTDMNTLIIGDVVLIKDDLVLKKKMEARCHR